jgi:D-alanyl-D-alanine carboxypeptidase
MNVCFLIIPIFLIFSCTFAQQHIPLYGNLQEAPLVEDPLYYENTNVYNDYSFDFPLADVIEQMLSDAVSKGLPGLIMLIDSPDWGTWVCAKGYIDLKNNIPMKNNSLSRIGSITKTFVSVIVLQLADEGSLSLSDPISNYLPDEIVNNVENAKLVTIRQLLNHTSGIFNYTEILNPETFYSVGSNKELTSKNTVMMVYGKHAYFKPGMGWHYSNTAYVLLGMIIEKITGKSLGENFTERIFTPLGLSSTYYDPDNPVHMETARGYIDYYDNGYYLDMTDFDSSCRTPDGGIVSCVYDMASFIKKLFNDGSLISESAFYEMTNNLNYWRSEADARIDYGLGIEQLSFTDGVLMYGHSGAHGSYSAYLYYYPEGKMTITALFNSSRLKGKSADIINTLWAEVLSLTEKAALSADNSHS